jgi:hypothetical protein
VSSRFAARAASSSAVCGIWPRRTPTTVSDQRPRGPPPHDDRLSLVQRPRRPRGARGDDGADGGQAPAVTADHVREAAPVGQAAPHSTATILYDPEGLIEAQLRFDRAPYECLVKAVRAWAGPDTLRERDFEQIALQLTACARAAAADLQRGADQLPADSGRAGTRRRRPARSRSPAARAPGGHCALRLAPRPPGPHPVRTPGHPGDRARRPGHLSRRAPQRADTLRRPVPPKVPRSLPGAVRQRPAQRTRQRGLGTSLRQGRIERAL